MTDWTNYTIFDFATLGSASWRGQHIFCGSSFCRFSRQRKRWSEPIVTLWPSTSGPFDPQSRANTRWLWWDPVCSVELHLKLCDVDPNNYIFCKLAATATGHDGFGQPNDLGPHFRFIKSVYWKYKRLYHKVKSTSLTPDLFAKDPEFQDLKTPAWDSGNRWTRTISTEKVTQ